MNKKLKVQVSEGFADWLLANRLSIAFSTYQRGKLFFVGVNEHNHVALFERTFKRCMGLWTDSQTIFVATEFQIWRFENVFHDAQNENGFDRLFVPMASFTTGDVDVHDIAKETDGRIVFANARFSCIATLNSRFNFTPVWNPSFIDELTAEDRCHLNGLAVQEGTLRFVTVCGQTNRHQEWRDKRVGGGCIIDVQTDETIVKHLSMPHSPRFHDQRLWLLNSGAGYLGYVDLSKGRFERVCLCPGYARGLALVKGYAIVGTSLPRHGTFRGLPLEDELARRGIQPSCGLQIFDVKKGSLTHWMHLEGVEELYDVVVLHGVRRAKALGLKTSEISDNVWFENNGTLCRWTRSNADVER